MSTTTSYETIDLTGPLDVDIGDEQTYADKLIYTNGHDVRFDLYGSGWELKNIGVIAEGRDNEVRIGPQVPNDPNGVGLIQNLYVENITNNFNFVNRHHEGHIEYRACTFINNLNEPQPVEDAIYGSSPGNPGNPVKPIGWAGTIDVIDCYFEDLGGYGARISPDGSIVSNTTIVGTDSGGTNKAMANNFGGGFTGYEGNHPPEEPGVTFRNCDVGGNVSTGLQVGPHQTDKIDAMTYGLVARIEDCRIDATYPVRAYTTLAGTSAPNYPTINGVEYPPTRAGSEARLDANDITGLSTGADLTPPAAAPKSAVAAASGGAERSIIRLSSGGA